MERGGGGREVEAVGFMPEQKRERKERIEEMKYREIEQNRNTKISLNILV